MNRTIKRLAIPVAAAAIIGTTGFAYMASNSVDASYVGQGTSTISGFNVTDISYYTSAGDLTYVNFNADPQGPHQSSSDPANAEINFGGADWYSCTRTSLNRALTPESHFVCDLRGQGVHASVTGMNVVVSH